MMLNNKFGNTDKYADIIDMPHHISSKHKQMNTADRAAQFSPFAALTGYGEAVRETARLTDERIELDDSAKAVIDEKLHIIAGSDDLNVAVTYFKEDKRKSGGTYLTAEGTVKKINTYEGNIFMEDKTIISIDDIYNIDIV